MLKGALNRVVRPLRVLAGKFVILPDPEDGTFIGQHGCINTAASFYTWNQVEGDYLEFGVYRGASFVTAYHSIQRARALHAPWAMGKSEEYLQWRQTRPRFFAFDSFEGLPPGAAQRQVDYEPGAYQCSEEGFRQNVIAGGVEPSEVVVVPGFYDQSLTTEVKQRHALRKAAVVMIDCDLYESTMPVLRFLSGIL